MALPKPEHNPKKILLSPNVLHDPALAPMNTLKFPVVLQNPARNPKKLLQHPVVLDRPEQVPKKLFEFPVVLQNPATNPKKVLKHPDEFDDPVYPPTKTFCRTVPKVNDLPALSPMAMLSVPSLLNPAHLPAKIFRLPVPPHLPAHLPTNIL